MWLLKVLAVLILAGVIGLAVYAYFGDMQPARSEVRHQIPTPEATSPPLRPDPVPASTSAPASLDPGQISTGTDVE